MIRLVTAKCLRIFAIFLLAVYIFNAVQIARLGKALGGGVPVQPGYSESRCALSDLARHYASASLLWLCVIAGKRRGSERTRGTIVLVSVLSSIMIHPISREPFGQLIASRDISTFESYSPRFFGNERISFRLHDPDLEPIPDKFSGVVGYRCSDKADLPSPLSTRTVLNFTTTITSNIKIVFVGDSISEQFAQAVDASLLGTGFESNRLARTYRNGRQNENVHTCFSVSAPVRGGGVFAFWRIATLMSASTRHSEFKCQHQWTTWNEGQAERLIEHQYTELDARLVQNQPLVNYTVNEFDAVVMRIPHGWLKIHELTKERIVEAIDLASSHLGAETVIIPTLQFNNNVLSQSDWRSLARINHILRGIARDPPKMGKAKRILIQEFGNFTSQVIFANAKSLGMIEELPDFSTKDWQLKDSDFLFKRLSAESFWAPSISMVRVFGFLIGYRNTLSHWKPGKLGHRSVRTRLLREPTTKVRQSMTVYGAKLAGMEFIGALSTSDQGIRHRWRVYSDVFTILVMSHLAKRASANAKRLAMINLCL